LKERGTRFKDKGSRNKVIKAILNFELGDKGQGAG